MYILKLQWKTTHTTNSQKLNNYPNVQHWLLGKSALEHYYDGYFTLDIAVNHQEATHNSSLPNPVFLAPVSPNFVPVLI